MSKSKYDDWCRDDIISPLQQRFVKGEFEIELDGDKEVVTRNTVSTPLQPWHFPGKYEPDRLCEIWKIYFNSYRIIPKGCLGCWKVMFRPKDIVEFMGIVDLQEEQAKKDIFCKAGHEERQIVFGLWSAFWYVPHKATLEEARKFYGRILKDIRKVRPTAGKDNPILKRGCTEMENFSNINFNVGSDHWETLYDQYGWAEVEKRLEGKFKVDRREQRRPQQIEKAYMKRKAVEWAYSYGDYKYKEFTDGRPLFTPPVTYNE